MEGAEKKKKKERKEVRPFKDTANVNRICWRNLMIVVRIQLPWKEHSCYIMTFLETLIFILRRPLVMPQSLNQVVRSLCTRQQINYIVLL